jgi:hypothetical protein
VRAILEASAVGGAELEVSLVQERRRAEREIGPAAAQLARGNRV